MTPEIKVASSLEVDHREVLAAAVKAIGGTERPGQVEMADAIAECWDRITISWFRLALAPASHWDIWLRRCCGWSGIPASGLSWQPRRWLCKVSWPTTTYRPQLMPSQSVTGRRPQHAILKGRTNYVCLLRLREGTAQDQGALIPAGDLIETIRTSPQITPESALGAEVLALRAWAENQANEAVWPTGMTLHPIPNEPGLRSRSRFGVLGCAALSVR